MKIKFPISGDSLLKSTQREIVKCAVEFRSPERVGLLYLDDDEHCDVQYIFDFFQKNAEGIDLWGNRWMVHPDFPSTGYVHEHPCADWTAFDNWQWPDPAEFARMTIASYETHKPALLKKDKYRLIASSSGIWERSQYLHGMENCMIDFYEEPQRMKWLIGRITDVWVDYLEQLQLWRGEIDAFFMFDDWGTQTDTMISRAQWDEFFLPHYRRIADACHRNGMHFWLHSCGKVTEFIEGFIAAGIDCVNPFQTKTCGYEEVARRYAGRICFATTVDTQTTLKDGPFEQITREAALLAKWGTPAGGLIVRSYQYDIEPANEQAVLDYFLSHPIAG